MPDDTREECAVLKAVAAHFVMHARERIDVHTRQREVVADLVAGYQQDPVGRLDPDLLVDWKSAESNAAALRVIVDQVASLTDVRAEHLHRAWTYSLTTGPPQPRPPSQKRGQLAAFRGSDP